VSPFLSVALSGTAATAAGIGLARFAFVPLFPLLVAEGWVSGGEAALLGAAALLGYLGGVGGAQALAARIGTRAALRLGMALVALSLALCVAPGGVWWLLPWRLLAGVAGGVLMSLAGPAVQRAVPPARSGAASGLVIAGVGCGIVLGALPSLLPGAAAGWAGLAVLAAALAAFAWRRFPAEPVAPPRGTPPPAFALLLAYALSGAGMVAPMVFLSDLAARGAGGGEGWGIGVWLLFGLGALGGTLLGGRATDRWGGAAMVRLWLLVQAAALGAALLPGGLAAAALLGGFSGMGISAVALAWAREVAGPAAGALWVRATLAYAAAQAGTGVALAALFAATGDSHAAVFGAGLALSLLALIPAMSRRP